MIFVQLHIMEYSTIKRRLAAYLLDLFFVLGGGTLSLIVLMTTIYGDQKPSENSIWLLFMPFIATWIYFVASYLVVGVTLGKKILGIKLVKKDGTRLNQITVLIREFLKLFSLGFLNGLFSMFHDKNRRTWYDRLVGSAVVKTKKEKEDKFQYIKLGGILSGVFLLILFAVISTNNSSNNTVSQNNVSETAQEEQTNTDTFATHLSAARKDHHMVKTTLNVGEYNKRFKQSTENVSKHLTSMGVTMSDSDKLTSIVSGNDESGAKNFISDIAAIQNEADDMTAITPPAEAQSLHLQYTYALKNYSIGCNEIVKALDDPDNSEAYLQNATSIFNGANEKMNTISKEYSK